MTANKMAAERVEKTAGGMGGELKPSSSTNEKASGRVLT